MPVRDLDSDVCAQSRGQPWQIALVASTTVLFAQVLRVVFPLGYRMGEQVGFLRAGLVVMALFLAPLAAPLLRRALGDRAALVVCGGCLGAARLLLQVERGATFPVAAVATVIGLVTLALVVSRVDAAVLAVGVVTGLVVDVGLRAAFLTWDHVWQAGPMPALVAVALVVAFGAAVRKLASSPPPHMVCASAGVVALGPFLFLETQFLASPAFAASQTDQSASRAVTLVLVALAAGLATARGVTRRHRTRSTTVVMSATLAVVLVVLLDASGAAAAGALVVAQICAVVLLSISQTRRSRLDGTRLAAAMTTASLAFITGSLLYQIHYELPLPVPNTALAPIAALALGALALGPVEHGIVVPRVLVAAPLLLLIVPAAVVWTDPAPQLVRADITSFRLVSYNVHEAVSTDGHLDPDAIAAVIEHEHPDVVVLQEVARGWNISGGIDLVEWLSRRLRMTYIYAPAADGQFGNVVLSWLPVTASETGRLAKGAGPMTRSYAQVELDLGRGRRVTVVDAHLQHRDTNVATRLTEIDELLHHWDGRANTVIAGDMNAVAGTVEIARFTAAGFDDAQGGAGLGAIPTSTPGRIDWIFATRSLRFSDFDLTVSDASDHSALAVTITVS